MIIISTKILKQLKLVAFKELFFSQFARKELHFFSFSRSPFKTLHTYETFLLVK